MFIPWYAKNGSEGFDVIHAVVSSTTSQSPWCTDALPGTTCPSERQSSVSSRQPPLAVRRHRHFAQARAVNGSYTGVTFPTLRDVTSWGEPPCSPTYSPCSSMLAAHSRRAEERTASSSARAANAHEHESSPQMQPGASRAAAAAAVHQYQSCTWLHDRHRCANRCALIRYA